MKNNTLRYKLHNNWETHVKMKYKKKQSWKSKNIIETEETFDHPQSERQGGASLEECEDFIGLEEAGRGGSGNLESGSSHENGYATTGNSNNEKQTKPKGSFDHPHTMRQGGAPLGRCEDFKRLGGAGNRGGRNLESDSSHKINYAVTENSNSEKQTLPRGNSDHPHTRRQGGESRGYCEDFGEIDEVCKDPNTGHRFGGQCINNHEVTKEESRFKCANPWDILDHPHTTRQGGTSLMEFNEIKNFGEAQEGGEGQLDTDNLKFKF